MKIYDESIEAKYHCCEVKDQEKILKLMESMRFMK